jgi:hypothetical protein
LSRTLNTHQKGLIYYQKTFGHYQLLMYVSSK